MPEFYRIVRVRPNGSETLIRDIPFADVTEEQQRRAEAMADAETRKASGIHIRVYSSDENGLVTPDDLIWDSAVN